MPSVPERERVYPPYQLHLWCSPHFGCPSPALDPRILCISVCPTAHVVYTGDPRLCSQLCEIRKQHIPTFARALFPRSTIFCFLWLFPRDWSCRLFHLHCTAHQSHSQTCFLIFFPACWPANRSHCISLLHSTLWKMSLPCPCQSHPSQLSIQVGSLLCTACQCLESTQLGWQQANTYHLWIENF